MKIQTRPKDAGIPVVDLFAGHRGLCQLYADRILAGVDSSRVGHSVVDAGLRAALGAQPELCPTLAEKLGVAVLRDQPFDVVSPAPAARLTNDRQRRLPNIRQGEGVFWHSLTIARQLERSKNSPRFVHN